MPNIYLQGVSFTFVFVNKLGLTNRKKILNLSVFNIFCSWRLYRSRSWKSYPFEIKPQTFNVYRWSKISCWSVSLLHFGLYFGLYFVKMRSELSDAWRMIRDKDLNFCTRYFFPTRNLLVAFNFRDLIFKNERKQSMSKDVSAFSRIFEILYNSKTKERHSHYSIIG